MTTDRQTLRAEALLWRAERDRRVYLRNQADTGPWMQRDLEAAGIHMEPPPEPWDMDVFVGTIDGQPFTVVEDDIAWYTSYIHEWALYRGHLQDGIPEDVTAETVVIPSDATPREALYALVWALTAAGLLQPLHPVTLLEAEYTIAQHRCYEAHPAGAAFLKRTRWERRPISLVEQTRALAVETFGERFMTTMVWDATRMEVQYPEPRQVAPDASMISKLVAHEHAYTRQISLPCPDGTFVRLDLDMYGAWHVYTRTEMGRVPITMDTVRTPTERWRHLLFLLRLKESDEDADTA